MEQQLLLCLESFSLMPSLSVRAQTPEVITYEQLTKPLIVQYLPDWFPGTGFKALAKEVREKYKVSLDGPMEYVKEAMKVSL